MRGRPLLNSLGRFHQGGPPHDEFDHPPLDSQEKLVFDAPARRASIAAQTRVSVCLFPSQNLQFITKEGLLIPKEVAERTLGQGSEELLVTAWSHISRKADSQSALLVGKKRCGSKSSTDRPASA
jgi:hypothetical protein